MKQPSCKSWSLLTRDCSAPAYHLRPAGFVATVLTAERFGLDTDLCLGLGFAAPGGHDVDTECFADGNLPVLADGAARCRP